MKVLIIKLGYSETLDPEISRTSSLGDIVRTTPILRCYDEDHVTWLTDEKAYPLLSNNPFINRVICLDLISVLQLQNEQFDIVINFEKIPGLCALTDSIRAWSKYGFRFDTQTGEVQTYENSHEAYYVYNSLDRKRGANRIWQEVLYEMIGQTWHGEEYVIGPRQTEQKYQIGLNYRIGPKWRNKKWPVEKWRELGKLLVQKGYSVSVQRGERDLETYLDWINSCELVVTQDSLGLHLAIAFKKKIVALFGPTISNEVHLYGLGDLITVDRNCSPCMETECPKGLDCMHVIKVNDVFERIERLLNG